MPTDFSKNARNVIRDTLDLYAEQICSFYFLNVYQEDGYGIGPSSFRPELGQRSYEIEKKEIARKVGTTYTGPSSVCQKYQTHVPSHFRI